MSEFVGRAASWAVGEHRSWPLAPRGPGAPRQRPSGLPAPCARPHRALPRLRFHT